jgi:hypothetical protein
MEQDSGYELRVAGPAHRQLNNLPEGTATATVEFMLGALVYSPQRVGKPENANSPDSDQHDAAPTGSSTKSTNQTNSSSSTASNTAQPPTTPDNPVGAECSVVATDRGKRSRC